MITAIISPDNLRTEITVNQDFLLTGVDYADTSHYGFEYTSEGLMTAKVEPKGNRFERIFDTSGRVTDAMDAEGGHWQFDSSYSSKGERVSVMTSAEGQSTTVLMGEKSSGQKIRAVTDSHGVTSATETSADGLYSATSLPDGTRVFTGSGWDSYRGSTYTKKTRLYLPSGKNIESAFDRIYSDLDNDGLADIITNSATVNAKTATVENDLRQGLITATSPMGRKVTTQYDPDTLLLQSVSVPGLLSANTEYDSRGRVSRVATGTRSLIYSYNNQGLLETITDADNRTTTFNYDPVGRVKTVYRPDNTTIGYEYDLNGNMSVLTTPSLVDHGFGYNNINRNDEYATPLSGSYRYLYDRDKRLLKTVAPSGETIENVFDKNRLAAIITPFTQIDFGYLSDGRLESISGGGESIRYDYDGSRLSGQTMSGTINASFDYSYNSDFRLATFFHDGIKVNYHYDDDGLLTTAGTFTIIRNSDNGLAEAVFDTAYNQARSHNGYSEISDVEITVSNTPVHNWSLTRSNTGRITDKQQNNLNYHYEYDQLGRLLKVKENNVLVEEYRYDANGNRTYENNAARNISGRIYDYSDGDHLLTAGDVTYHYDVDGYLVERVQGGETTSYAYSTRGELLEVTLPDGTLIEYLHDPLGRRIAKLVNGAVTEKYLWSGPTTLHAVYDGNDNLKIRFEYTDERMPPAMTKNGTRYYLAYDQVDTLKRVINPSGNIVKELTHDTFGNIITDSNPGFTTPFGFAGGLHDPDTNLIRFGARDYAPEIGRWTAKDPILFAGGDTNLYGYVLGDPVGGIDPEGMAPQDRVTWAIEQYNNNKDFWKGSLFKGYNHCNEFVMYAHVDGDPDAMGYPTVLRNNGYPFANVSNLADPNFARDKLDYLPIQNVQPGDIVVWYGNGNHHTAIAIGNDQVIYQNATEGVKKNSISKITKSYKGTYPIVRRFRY